VDKSYEAARRQDYAAAHDLYLQARSHPDFNLEAVYEDFNWVIEWLPAIFAQAGDQMGFESVLREGYREEGNLSMNYVMPVVYARWELPADLRSRIEASTTLLAQSVHVGASSEDGELHRYWGHRHIGVALYRLGETGRALELLTTATRDQFNDCSLSAKAFAALAAWKEGRYEEARKWREQAEKGFRTRVEAGEGVLDPIWWHLAATDLALKEARDLMGDASGPGK
jgi:tetratricopeptide (TPR) repeat protein